MALIQLEDLCVSYGGPPVLDHVNLTIEPGERVGLVGRNGEGKSTLLKVVAGDLKPDSGVLRRGDGVRVARLAQEVPRDAAGSVFEVVSQGLGELGTWIATYHKLTVHLEAETDAARRERLLADLGRAGAALDAADGWSANSRVEGVLSRMGLDPDAPVQALSSGMKRRVLLAQALAGQPALLLLDEPTNHLDLDAITWLERFLAGFGAALLFITHDRMFLEKLATRIVELDRGQLTSWPGRFSKYQEGKAALLEAEATQNALFDKRLAKEEAWIRQGIKARRTRNEGRVRALEKMRVERARRRERTGTVRMSVDAGERSGKLVVEVKDAGFAYPGAEPVIRGLSTAIMRGDRVGIVGPNGAGKSTLIRMLLGELAPTQGAVRLGTGLEVAYFDQLRATLNDADTVRQAVADGLEELLVGGRKRHVMSYLRDFLFSPERAQVRVEKLSGGERNRLLLARLFTKPANLLVMDEPTNDLDTETLELLEELLAEYPGTLLLVSHDRAFLNNVTTSLLVFEGGGRVAEYVGGYDDWLAQRARPQAPPAPEPGAERPVAPPAAPAERRRLSYQEKKELDALPARIDALETEHTALAAALADPDLYRDAARAAESGARLAAVEAALEAAYARWAALEGDKG
ncbi:MAG: ATP-binding cassette domain-containing protein [Nitrospirae bacterium]|nr:ATP-binding cassette domain-containing protein [Nitrospirota bacterium]